MILSLLVGLGMEMTKSIICTILLFGKKCSCLDGTKKIDRNIWQILCENNIFAMCYC